MKIETRDFGTMEVSEEQLITFPDGLYAFEDSKHFANYQISLGEGEKAILKINDDSKLMVLCIANVPEDFKDTTVNMKSPIVVNMDNKLAMQIILPHNYPYCHPIYQKSEQEA